MASIERAEHLAYMKKLRAGVNPERVKANLERLRKRELSRRTKRTAEPVLQIAGVAAIVLGARWLFKKGKEQEGRASTKTTARRAG